MSSTYSPDLRIELITTGEQAGVWGVTTNNNLANVIEQAVAGYVSVAITSVDQALTYTNGGASTGAANQSVYAMIALTTSLTNPIRVYVPPSPKMYTFYNTGTKSATIYNSTSIGNTTAAGTGAIIPAGSSLTVWSDGTNVRPQIFNNWDLGTGFPVAAQRYIQLANASADPAASAVVSAKSDVQNLTIQALSGTAAISSGLALAGKATLYSTGSPPSAGNSGSTGLYIWDNSYTPQIDFIIGSGTVAGTINSSGNWSFNSKTLSSATWNGAIIGAAYGGTGNGFFAVTGPTTSTKTFTFPNANATVLTDSALVTPGQGGTGFSNGYTIQVTNANQVLNQSVAIGGSPTFGTMVANTRVSIGNGGDLTIYNTGNTGFGTLTYNGNEFVASKPLTVYGTLLADTVSVNNGGPLNIYSSGNIGYAALTYNNTALLSNSPVSVTGTVTGTSITSTNNATINGLTAGQGNLVGASATAFGYQALSASVTGTYNTDNAAFGYQAGKAITTSGRNVAVGSLALVGTAGALTATSSTLFGGNVGIGYAALYSANSDATMNTAIGYSAGSGIATGRYNTFIGGNSSAPATQTTASRNIAIGVNAGGAITTGNNNTMIGVSTGTSTGSNNVLLGYLAGSYITSGSSNVVIGGYIGFAAPISQLNSNYIVLSDGDGNISWYSTPSGANVQPRQPSFTATLSTTQSNVIGNSSIDYKVPFDVVQFDRASNFSGGTFTAPVTGLYRFSMSVELTITGATNTAGYLRTTAMSYTFGYNQSASFAGFTNLSGSVLAQMTAGDTAIVTVIATGMGSTTGAVRGQANASTQYTYFSGELVA